jgi:hypothetical protein
MHVVFGLADAMCETARWAGGPLAPSRYDRPCPEVNKLPGQGAATSHLFIKLYTRGLWHALENPPQVEAFQNARLEV